MAIYFVDFPMKNGDFPWQNVNVYQRVKVILMAIRNHQIPVWNDGECFGGIIPIPTWQQLVGGDWNHGILYDFPYGNNMQL